MVKQTIFKLNLASMVWASAVIIAPTSAWAQSATKVSQTNLAKVAATVDKVNQLMRQTINQTMAQQRLQHGQAFAGRASTVNSHYILGQGLNIHIGAIDFKSRRPSTQRQTAPTLVNDEQANSQILAVVKSAAKTVKQRQLEHRVKAKDMAHNAHHLREQAKSLRLSVNQSQGVQQSKFKQQLQQVEERARALALERKNHAALFAQGPNSSPQAIAALNQQRFYYNLVEQVSQVLCQQATLLATIDGSENIAVIYQQGGKKAGQGYKTKGWMVSRAQLSQCGKGQIELTQLTAQATEYQY